MEYSARGANSALIVARIGASASSLACLKTAFARLPSDSGLIFVVVVHLAPKHLSHFADLLQRHAHMPAIQATEDVPWECNHHKVEEQSQLTSCPANFMAATHTASMFLDRELRILRVTPRVLKLFNMRALDRG